ncbi:cytochrome P450 [Mycena rebaudengoi]|nr:cytochrome P450 [Mycena rebaudengoi]
MTAPKLGGCKADGVNELTFFYRHLVLPQIAMDPVNAGAILLFFIPLLIVYLELIQSSQLGNMLDLLLPCRYGDHEYAWQKIYGPESCLMVSDPLALQHILTGNRFERGATLQNILNLLTGEGSVTNATGETHRRLRDALNLSFTPAAISKFRPVFERTAQMISTQFEESLAPGSLIDICPALFTGTLSAVSDGIFGCSVEDMGEDLVKIHQKLLVISSSRSAAHIAVDRIIQYLPSSVLRLGFLLPTSAFTALRKFKTLANQLGTRLVNSKLEASRQGLENAADVYSTLLHPDRLNKTKHVLSATEVAAQTQDQLRAEILSSPRGRPGGIPYDEMPLLNAFIKETLRMYPIEPLSEQIANQDTFLPLTKGITTTTGEHITRIPIQKGQLVSVAIASYQRLESIWGLDANEYNPNRWLEGTIFKGDLQSIGPYANLLRLSYLVFMLDPAHVLGKLLEMQVVVYELIGKFSFSLPENDSVRPYYATTLMPALANGEKGVLLQVTGLL